MRGDSYKYWWLSSRNMTILVKTYNGKIIEAPFIARKFVGQALKKLSTWMEAQGSLRVKEIKPSANRNP